MEPLAEVCERYGVMLIEDASEALGACFTTGKFAGRQVGTIGEIGCFSFNGNKIITAGAGGMIVTQDEKLARRAKHLTTQAKLPGIGHRHDEIGYNYRLSNLSAALGLSQLELLPSFLARKREIRDSYNSAFRDFPGVGLPPHPSWSEPSNWLYTLQIDPERAGAPRDKILNWLLEHKVEARPIWAPLHTQSVYAKAPRIGGNVAEMLCARGLSLPSSCGLTESQQNRVIDLVTSALRV
jgi:dTDP-4-amino-4,6-dideoxygalactose transaminase